MPSPFPGMDPYLEDPGLWPDVHHRLISIVSDLIAERVRPKYYVRIEDRVYLPAEDDDARPHRVPDVLVSSRSGWEGRPYWPGAAGGVEIAEPVVATTLQG